MSPYIMPCIRLADAPENTSIITIKTKGNGYCARFRMQNARVAIIGAGPGGLTSAKAALECGLVPTVFERAKSAGGVWREPPSFAYDTMRTNFSSQSLTFSDFPWPKEPDHFPNRKDTCEYLQAYMRAFDLEKHIRFNEEVLKVDPSEGGWNVTTSRSGTDFYDHVIVAVGLNSDPAFPDIPGLKDDFSGTVLHAADYQTAQCFRDQTVLVIGNTFSGPDICSELVHGGAKRVVNVPGRPLWFLKRHLPGEIPYDWVFSRRGGSFIEYGEATIEASHKLYSEWSGKNPGDVSEALRIDPKKDLPYFAIAEDYLELVKKREIEVRRGLVGFKGNDALFESGERIQVDAILSATGYHLSLPLFDQHILDQFQPELSDRYLPLVLHKCTFPPALSNLAFVGIYGGSLLTAIELQARWVCMVFTTRLPPPTQAEIQEGIKEELKFRNSLHKTRVRYNHTFDDTLAKIIGAFPEQDLNGSGGSELSGWLWDGPLLSAHYRLCGPHAKREAAIEQIRKANERVQKQKSGT